MAVGATLVSLCASHLTSTVLLRALYAQRLAIANTATAVASFTRAFQRIDGGNAALHAPADR